MRAVFSFGLGSFLREESTNLLPDGSGWLLVFWDPSGGKGPRSHHWGRQLSSDPLFSAWPLTLTSLRCGVSPSLEPVRWTISKEKTFRLLLKMGRSGDVTVWGQGKDPGVYLLNIRTFNQSSWSQPLAILLFPELFWSHVWKLSHFMLVSLPYRLRFQLSLYFVKSVTTFLLPKCWYIYCLLSFTSCPCGFKPFEYSFTVISGGFQERAEPVLSIHHVSVMYF